MERRYYLIIALLVIAAVVIIVFLFRSKDERGMRSAGTTSSDTRYEPVGSLVFLSGENSDTLGLVHYELARDVHEQARGLMHKYAMPDSIGMLFVYEDTDHRSFWMKNTHISLDIIFADENKKIVHIHDYAIPYSEDLIPSKYPARYVVEVNAGYADRHGIDVGDRIGF